MNNCIFCNIVAGEIPAHIVYEDRLHLGFLDISQVNEGHILLVPKTHTRWVWEIADLGAFFNASKKIITAMQKITGSDQVSMFTIGEEVHHAHLHLIPAGSPGSMSHVYQAWQEAMGVRKLENNRMQAIAEIYRNEIGGV
jgi:histidine triad (HIT) family protein